MDTITTDGAASRGSAWRTGSLAARRTSWASRIPSTKSAVVQAAPEWLDRDGTVDKCIRLINEAADKGCKLIAFPETFVPGYPWHIWMGAPAWAIGRGFVQRYFDNSLSYDRPQAEKLRQAVKKAGCR